MDVEGTLIAEGALVVFKGADVRIRAKEKARFLLLGGKELPEKRHIWWNFVSSSKERIEEAKNQWTKQAYGKVRGESEWLLLPEK